ncbi:MAG: transposase [Candidatus Omnitrophica bacterium]|nr:transposase [Candidatus Omnitrophota bacterium]
MPRQAREIPLTGYLHIISRGNNKRKIFRYERDKKQYYLNLKKLNQQDKVNICHYCLMSNHIHLLVEIRQGSNLSRFMKRINLKYVYYYQRKYTYCGHLWQGRFQSKIINDELYLIQCGKYIELNPVRAGSVASPEDYPFSSYRYYGFGRKDSLITPNPLYRDLSARQDKRQRLYRNLVLEEENE